MSARKIFILLFIVVAYLGAESQYPVDVSFLIADLKYNQKDGVKICEIQHGILSNFFGDATVNGDPGLTPLGFQKVFSEFPLIKWVDFQRVSFINLRNLIVDDPSWIKKYSFPEILKDPDFICIGSVIPENPYDISSYAGMVYVRKKHIKDYQAIHAKFPGIIFIDAASFPFWIDKFKMSALFDNNPILSGFKPEWNLYLKKDLVNLAQKIQEDIKSEYYVIKPRSAFCGNGVIIVSKEDLDATLKYIFSGDASLDDDPDNAYNYWYGDSLDSFIVEKFYPSDALEVQSLGGNFYDPTMRVAFILIYNNQNIELRFLGDYWRLPRKSLDETGSLNELHKCCANPDLFARVSDEIRQEVTKQLSEALPLLYQQMLEYSSQ